MRRIFLILGLTFSLLSFNGCKQHDSQSPDTSGVDPQNPNQTPATGTDNGTGGANTNNGNNMNNDGTNNNQMVTTGDSSLNKKQRNQ